MTDEDVIALINQRIATEFELDLATMKPEAHLIDDLGLDSLDFVDMVVVLQSAFGLSLREEPGIQQIRLLGDIHRLVIGLVRAREQQS